jgi:ferric-dicitrate binding protein FerR (iron transport regulator)
MENHNDFIKDWLEGKVSPAELKSKKENGDTFVREYDELITRSAGLKVPDAMTKEDAWERLSGKLVETPKQEAKVIRIGRWIPLSIAASVTLLAIAFFVFNKATVTTQLAETKVYTLPDGSEVTLNAGSKIAYSRFNFSGERTVTLEGEAFFQVIKGSTFTVESENGTVTVLGTSFNVNTRPAEFEVSCFTGKVKVSHGTHEVMLTKGLFTRLDNSGLIAAETFDDKKTTWRQGDFYFDGEPVHRVVNELERQFNVEIILKGDSTRLYTGYFSNKNLDEALDMVFKPLSLNYTHETANKITVK